MTTDTQPKPSRQLSEQHKGMADLILLDFVSHYKRYNRAIAYTWWRWLMVKLRWAETLPDGGVYCDMAGNLCPVGMLMDPDTRSFMDRHRLNRKPFSSIAARWGKQLLFPKYQWLASDRDWRSFMVGLREIHDTTRFWDDNGINAAGMNSIGLLTTQYGLSTDRILSQAISTYQHRFSKRTFWQSETFKYLSIGIILVASVIACNLLDK